MANQNPEARGPGDSELRIRAVIHQFLVALHSGREPDFADWVARHSEWGPDFESRLERAVAAYRAAMARSSGAEPDWDGIETSAFSPEAPQSGGPPESSDPAEAPTEVATPHERLRAEEALRIRCPHCGHRIQIAVATDVEVVCRSCGSSFHVDSAMGGLAREQAQPAHIGRFAVLERLGRGGFGVVYKANDPLLSRDVAVKMPRAGYFDSAEDEERFLREARSAARLRHPHIVRIHEIDRHHGVPYIVSEYIEGHTLADVLAHQRLSFPEAAKLIIAVAEALEYAHEQHVVHRDVKPSNILIDAEGHPYVTDFGLARRDDSEITITVDGQVLGTPAYMSPEQAAGEQAKVDRRSDVYSLGVVLYHTICGELPFRGTRRMLVQQVMLDEPRPPRRINEHVPRDLETIILKALAKEPHRRYATAQQLADDLRRWLRHEPIQARRVGPVGRMARWGRRSPVVAGLCATIALLLVGAAIAASIWAWRERGLHTLATRERDRAEESEQTSRERLVQRHLQDAVQHLHAGDYVSALLWSAEAAAEDTSDRPLSDKHPLRIGLLLDRCPALKQLWDRPGQVTRAVWTAAADRVVMASDEGSLLVCDVASGQPAAPVMQHGAAITTVVIDRQGSRALSLGRDHLAQLWNLYTGERLATLAHDDQPLHADFSADGQLVATASRDGRARIWQADTGSVVTQVVIPDSLVNMARFSPDGTRLVTTSLQRTSLRGELRVWHSTTGEAVGNTMGHDAYVWHVVFSADGTRILSASEDRTVRVWDAHTGTPLGDPLRHDAPVLRAFWAADDSHIITAVSHGQVRVWNADTNELLPPIIDHGGTLTDAALSPSGMLIATCGVDGQTRVWSWPSRVEASPPIPHNALVTSVEFGDSDRYVLTGSQDGTVKLWDLAAAVPALTELVHAGPVRLGRFSPDGSCVLTTSDDRTARLWSVPTGAPIGSPLRHDAEVVCGAFHPSDALVATGSFDHTVQMWDLRSGNPVGPRLTQTGLVSAVAFSPDGRWLATAARDGSVKIWEVATQRLHHVLNHPAGILCIDYSRDGKWLATAGEDGTAQIWDALSGEAHGDRLEHDDLIYQAVFSPDSLYLVTGSRDRTARIWRVEDGAAWAPPLLHTASVVALQCCAERPLLCTGDLHGNTRIWQWLSWDLPDWSWKLPDREVRTARFAGAGTLLATALNRHLSSPDDPAGDGAACLWDLTTGKLLAPPWMHRGDLLALDVNPAGDMLLTTSTDPIARLWPLRTTALAIPDLVRLAQVLSGKRIDRSVNLVAMDAAALRAEFHVLRAQFPSHFSSSREDVTTWEHWLTQESVPPRVVDASP